MSCVARRLDCAPCEWCGATPGSTQAVCHLIRVSKRCTPRSSRTRSGSSSLPPTHLARLVERLSEHVPGLVTLHGDVTPRRRRESLERLSRLSADEPRLVLATGRFIGEGFDDPRLDTLLLAMPIAWKGTVVQYAGRLHRPHPAKYDARIYDYVDVNVPVLRRMFAKRAKTYRAMGYTTHSDAPPVGLPLSPDAWEQGAEQPTRVRGWPLAVSVHPHADERTRTST
jgi:hypothetical protein